jgi:V8-like Glu-specific endopeptidase
MPGIPKALLRPLRQTLTNCDEFRSQRQLSSLFIIDELSPWKSSLPEAESLNERVNLTISYLADKRTKSGENVLALFLKVLADAYDSEDERHELLASLTDQMEWMSSRPARPEPQSLEANLADGQKIWIEDVERMLECAKSVARIDVLRVSKGQNRGISTGTAWLIAPNLALTCRHVIEAIGPLDPSLDSLDLERQISNALFTFDYTSGGKGIQYKVSSLEYPLMESSSLDYALLRVEDRTDQPLLNRGYLRLDSDSPLTAQTSLYIIQHPLGQPQQVSGDLYIGPATGPGAILYKTLTDPGTSGSPVFNRASWGVVALHTGENKASRLREGLKLKAILSDIEKNREDLFREIQAAQNIKW